LDFRAYANLHRKPHKRLGKTRTKSPQNIEKIVSNYRDFLIKKTLLFLLNMVLELR
jgi:hypothetical protein